MDRIGWLYEQFFAWNFLATALGSLATAKLFQRIFGRSPSRGRIFLSYLLAPFGGFAAVWLANRLWPQIGFAGFTIGALLVTQFGLMAADMITASPPRVAEVFEEAPPPAKRRLLKKAAIWLVCIGAGFGLARLMVKADQARAIMAEAPADREEAHAWRAAPGAMQELKRLFPDEYRRILRENPAPAAALDRPDPYMDRNYAAWQQRLLAALRTFLIGQRPNIMRAPDAQLLEVSRTERAVFAQLQPYPSLCVGMAVGQVDRNDPAAREVASAAMHEASSALLIGQLRAARAGIDHPASRDLASLLPRAQMALDMRLRATSPELARLTADPTAFARATPAEKCRAVLANYDATLALPAEFIAALTVGRGATR